MAYLLKNILIYPIKSLGAIELNRALCLPKGLKHDRRWMLCNEDGLFISQRKFPEMTRFRLSDKDTHFEVHDPKTNSTIQIPYEIESGLETVTVQIWDDTCQAWTFTNEMNQWFSDRLSISCRLVFLPESYPRQIDLEYAAENEHVSFADGFPYLICGEESLQLLSSKMNYPVSALRFRPNFVFEGKEAHEEDYWINFKIGNVKFKAAKPCSRCQVPTLDPETGVADPNFNRVLVSYRLQNKKIKFGMNLLLNSPSDYIQINDPIELLTHA